MDTKHELKTVQLPNGETMAYREAGDPSNSKVLVLVHGAMGSSAVWIHLFPQFTDSFRVIAPDLRGHGQTTFVNPQKSHDDTAEDLKLLFDAIGLKKIYFLGWSMGGGVGMKFTANYPEYVEKLILHNSMGVHGVCYTKINEAGQPTTERISDEEECMNHPHPIFLSTLIKTKNVDQIKVLHEKRIYCGRNQPPTDRLELSIEDWLNCRASQRLSYLANIYNVTDEDHAGGKGTNQISKIKCPVLIIHGDRDVIVPVAEAKRIKELIGDNAELKTFPEGGHVVLEDYPEEFVQLTRDFFLAA